MRLMQGLDDIPGFVPWLTENKGKALVVLAKEAREKFGDPDITEGRIQRMKRKYGLVRRPRQTEPLTWEEKSFIIGAYDRTPPGKMFWLVKEHFGREIAYNRIRAFYRWLGIKPEEYNGKEEEEEQHGNN